MTKVEQIVDLLYEQLEHGYGPLMEEMKCSHKGRAVAGELLAWLEEVGWADQLID